MIIFWFQSDAAVSVNVLLLLFLLPYGFILVEKFSGKAFRIAGLDVRKCRWKKIVIGISVYDLI